MPTVAKKVFEDALSLPAETRVNLVEKLLNSLNLPTQPEIDRLWAEEAERRLAELRSGKVKPVPGDKVFAKIRERFKK